MKVAQAKLKEIGPDDMNMEEYKVKSFGARAIVQLGRVFALHLANPRLQFLASHIVASLGVATKQK